MNLIENHPQLKPQRIVIMTFTENISTISFPFLFDFPSPPFAAATNFRRICSSQSHALWHTPTSLAQPLNNYVTPTLDPHRYGHFDSELHSPRKPISSDTVHVKIRRSKSHPLLSLAQSMMQSWLPPECRDQTPIGDKDTKVKGVTSKKKLAAMGPEYCLRNQYLRKF
ncbi:unnamed protein product [Caenorhabditis nigoni]